MRTLLTYGLAILVCAVAVTLLRVAMGGLSLSGDANGITVVAFSFLLAAGFFAIFGSASWWLGGRILSGLGHTFSGSGILAKSVIIWLVVAMGLMAWDIAPAMMDILAGGGLPMGRMGNLLLANLPVFLGAGVLTGLVWGAVFWLREPNTDHTPEPTGHAA
ncbi:hypothetical protein [Hyphobacterium marinum]|uniref:Uncharacterized protein n=1 Tax=Hyphobacterium marinum TaxID=3116574 RepID=A0ABU7M168_9PROT|nr:hypothetical protein [Hyphobacterium sp. Y6023]MEE2567558.1 hypothetical protein [Hyphobacterium sp. Y6023]